MPEFGVQVSHHGPIPGAGAQHDLWRFFVNKKLREMSGFWFRPNINTDGGAAAGPVEWPVVNETSAVNYSKHCSSSNILSETSNGPGNGNNWLCVPHLYWLYYLYLFEARLGIWKNAGVKQSPDLQDNKHGVSLHVSTVQFTAGQMFLWSSKFMTGPGIVSVAPKSAANLGNVHNLRASFQRI